jgi:hypothetical protein
VAGGSDVYSPVGLQAWEIVVASGLCAVAALTIGTLIGAAVAFFVTRQPAPARATEPARPASVPQSAYAEPAVAAVAG